VVAEAAVALELAAALLEKTGGDSLAEVRRNLEAYLAAACGVFPPPRGVRRGRRTAGRTAPRGSSSGGRRGGR